MIYSLFRPFIMLTEALCLHLAPLSRTVPEGTPEGVGSNYLFLPLVSAIDPRVLDAHARFDCSQTEVIDVQQCDALLMPLPPTLRFQPAIDTPLQQHPQQFVLLRRVCRIIPQIVDLSRIVRQME